MFLVPWCILLGFNSSCYNFPIHPLFYHQNKLLTFKGHTHFERDPWQPWKYASGISYVREDNWLISPAAALYCYLMFTLKPHFLWALQINWLSMAGLLRQPIPLKCWTASVGDLGMRSHSWFCWNSVRTVL